MKLCCDWHVEAYFEWKRLMRRSIFALEGLPTFFGKTIVG